MALKSNSGSNYSAVSVSQESGLRQYMRSIYNYMAAGLTLTGLVAFFANSSGFYASIAHTPVMWLVLLAPIGIVFFLSFRIQSMSMGAAQAAYWSYAALLGLSLAGIFSLYTGESISRVFFITAGTFGGMSLFGYTTNRDLSGFGSFLMMGLVGIIIAGVVNMFLHSGALQFVISAIAVIVFVGLTAYDTQKLKALYSQAGWQALEGKKEIMGALTLYLDFINLFLTLLRFFGDSRR